MNDVHRRYEHHLQECDEGTKSQKNKYLLQFFLGPYFTSNLLDFEKSSEFWGAFFYGKSKGTIYL
jgi:hypothetical protein